MSIMCEIDMKSTLKLPAISVALKSARNARDLNQQEAASLCGVSRRLWWKWEHGALDSMDVAMEGALARLEAPEQHLTNFTNSAQSVKWEQVDADGKRKWLALLAPVDAIIDILTRK